MKIPQNPTKYSENQRKTKPNGLILFHFDSSVWVFFFGSQNISVGFCPLASVELYDKIQDIIGSGLDSLDPTHPLYKINQIYGENKTRIGQDQLLMVT